MLVGRGTTTEEKKERIYRIDRLERTVGLRAAATEVWQMRLGFDRRMPWMSS